MSLLIVINIKGGFFNKKFKDNFKKMKILAQNKHLKLWIRWFWLKIKHFWKKNSWNDTKFPTVFNLFSMLKDLILKKYYCKKSLSRCVEEVGRFYSILILFLFLKNPDTRSLTLIYLFVIFKKKALRSELEKMIKKIIYFFSI